MKSLKGFMKINRGIYFRKVIPSIDNSNGNIIVVPPSIPIVKPNLYTAADFGENAINNHTMAVDHQWHSETCQTIFNYITRNYRDRCTCFQTYNTPILNGGLIGPGRLLEEAKDVKADLIFTPYVNAAVWMNSDYSDFVLPFGSHYDNDATDGIIGNGDRHDITSSPKIFLPHSIAIAARRDTPATFRDEITSFGYGLEFIEDCSPEGLNTDFPYKDIHAAFAELLSNDGITLNSTKHPEFASKLTVGEEIVIKYTSDPLTWETTTITEIISNNSIRVSPSITPISNSNIYGWHYVTLGNYIYGQAQSWAVPIVAAKFKVIKLETGASWEIVREAARQTARRNPTGIPEYDNTDWDIYRGFGCVDMQKAINLINSKNII